MALAEQVKKGGRYTKKEQEERRIQVYHLRFEEEKPATKIAKILNVNRNTINEDIQYWNKQLACEFKAQDLTTKMVKQFQRMEIQRDRLLEDLEEVETLDEKIRLEKFIADLDNRLTQFCTKMILSGNQFLGPKEKQEISEEEIKEFVRDLILSDTDPNSEDLHSENDLKFDFIKKTKCNVKHADEIIEKMKQDGLVLCEQSRKTSDFTLVIAPDFSITYNLAKFANLREYLTMDEFSSIMTKRFKLKQEIEDDEKQREEQFVKKFGPKHKWSEEVKEMFDDPFEEIE